MDDTDSSRVRKRLMSDQVCMTGESAGEIDIARHAPWPIGRRIRISCLWKADVIGLAEGVRTSESSLRHR